jgi:hypothetical protein
VNENGRSVEIPRAQRERNMEKRKEKRFVEQHDVLIKDERLARHTATDGVVYGYTGDISLSGARVVSQQVFPVGCVWRILIDLKRNDEFLRVDGKVLWVKKCKNAQRFVIGVEFLHRYPDTIRLLIKHLYGREGDVPAVVS